MLKKYLFFIYFLCLIFGINNCFADMYAIKNIHVDTTAENATIAREQGLNDAQEKAFYKMLERLTLFQYMESLPVLTSEDILNLVQDFSVSNEKTSSVRYIADVDVQFNPHFIQTFFQEYQVPYVNTTAEKSIVLPVFKENLNAHPLLWNDTNLWHSILSKKSVDSDLVPFVVPLGDLQDIAVISEDNLNQEENLDIHPLLNRYQAQHALVMELTLLKEENALKVMIRPFQKHQIDFQELVLTEPLNAPLEEVFKRAADRSIYLLEQKWKEKNALRFDNPTKLNIQVGIQNLGEWISIRKRLDKIPLIKQYVVKTLQKDQAQIEVFYAGQLAPFQDALKKENLFLSLKNNTWLLRELSDVPPEELNKPQVEDEAEDEKAAEENTLGKTETLLDKSDKETSFIPEPDIKTFNLELYQQIDELIQNQQIEIPTDTQTSQEGEKPNEA